MLKLTHCRHFDGTANGICRAGVRYDSLPSNSLPCIDRFRQPGTDCEKRSMYTAEEIAADKAEQDRIVDCHRRGVSMCCEAPLDDSRVIRAGRYAGHGPRFCSKCGRCVAYS